MRNHWRSALVGLTLTCAFAAGSDVANAQETPQSATPPSATEKAAPKLAPPSGTRAAPAANGDLVAPELAPPKAAAAAPRAAETPAPATPSRDLFAAQLDNFGKLLNEMHFNCVAGMEADGMGDATSRNEYCLCHVTQIAENFSPRILTLFRSELTADEELNVRRTAPASEMERLETFFNDLLEGRGAC